MENHPLQCGGFTIHRNIDNISILFIGDINIVVFILVMFYAVSQGSISFTLPAAVASVVSYPWNMSSRSTITNQSWSIIITSRGWKVDSLYVEWTRPCTSVFLISVECLARTQTVDPGHVDWLNYRQITNLLDAFLSIRSKSVIDSTWPPHWTWDGTKTHLPAHSRLANSVRATASRRYGFRHTTGSIACMDELGMHVDHANLARDYHLG